MKTVGVRVFSFGGFQTHTMGLCGLAERRTTSLGLCGLAETTPRQTGNLWPHPWTKRLERQRRTLLGALYKRFTKVGQQPLPKCQALPAPHMHLIQTSWQTRKRRSFEVWPIALQASAGTRKI